ncbi:MAG: YggS family pyridoxal phosphate-dependent enzyme [Tolumonas sp.]|nr:MAG: YggS family pyridoxal phosphate-dependent enzyme [Tolumonas sp.]
MNDIESRLLAIKEQIASHARQTGRQPEQIKLLAVSKTKPAEAIQAAYQAGQRLFGESYVQEAVTKVQYLKNIPDYADIEWHFIGPLQSNKTLLVAENFDWIPSIEREKIAQRLNEQRPAHLPALNICIQVNISGEQTKSGITADEVFGLAGIISNFPRLKLRGLMTIAENTDDLNIVRDNFLQMQELYNRLKNQYPSVDTLSMGMTDDMAVAIECGSTMVRIGTAIFGSREYK